MNAYGRLLRLLPKDPLLIGTVTDHNDDGTSTLLLIDGRPIRVRGQDVAVGLKAFIRAGRVEGEAPNLPLFNVTV